MLMSVGLASAMAIQKHSMTLGVQSDLNSQPGDLRCSALSTASLEDSMMVSGNVLVHQYRTYYIYIINYPILWLDPTQPVLIY